MQNNDRVNLTKIVFELFKLKHKKENFERMFVKGNHGVPFYDKILSNGVEKNIFPRNRWLWSDHGFALVPENIFTKSIDDKMFYKFKNDFLHSPETIMRDIIKSKMYQKSEDTKPIMKTYHQRNLYK